MSSRPPADLDYAASLRAYLEEPGESALKAAYELGRAAIDHGAGVIDIVSAHAEAVGSILDGSAADAISARSIPFLVECLAPLEMAHRGFMEANRALQTLNADLELRIRERTRQLDEANRTLQTLNADLELHIRERTRQLEDANKDLESFAYSVSHDLRAPLRAIDGFSQTLIEDCAPRLDDDGRFAIERVRVNAIRMERLIDDMLHLARISHGELSPGPTDLGALARQILAELREQRPDRNLDARIAEGLVADVDPDFIRIALANLLSNAFKFTGSQTAPRIDFASETRDGEVVYYVRDNGVGFDMAYAEQIFRPFERLHSQDEFPGTGIGLATVQRVIRRHGGRIWADAALGRGATFFFTLNGTRSGAGAEHGAEH
jgi:light-regulated signal transduction histidine kinase (bacteriophytochrome)